MLEQVKPDYVIAFHNNIYNSKGTKHMINIALQNNIPVYLATDIQFNQVYKQL